MRCFIQQPDDVLRLHVTTAQCRPQNQPRARSSQYARQKVLNVACQLGAGVVLAVQRDNAGSRTVFGECGSGSLGTQKALDELDQIADRGRAPG